MAKHPWLKWFPNDWLGDEAVRACSLAAKGLWIDMLCLMHKSRKRGHLLIGDRPPTAAELARMTGASEDHVIHLLDELKTAGVFSQNDDGIIVSRRMVRDEKKAKKCAIAGRKGGGNPALRNESTFIGVDKGDDKGDHKGVPKGTSGVWHMASSSSSPGDKSAEKRGTGDKSGDPTLPPALDTDAFRAAWADYEAYRREKKASKLTHRSVQLKWGELQELGHDGAIAAIKHSIANGWQGIFPDRQGSGGQVRSDTPVTRLAAKPGKYDRFKAPAENGVNQTVRVRNTDA